jgi:hypothetical protein
MTTNVYWDVTAERAAAFHAAAKQPGALSAVLPVLAQHADDFGLHTTTHVAQMVLAAAVHEDCPAAWRTPRGTADLDLMVPPTTDPASLLTAAETLRDVYGMPLDEGVTSAEHQAVATARARAAVQDALDAVPDGAAGRERMLERFWQLRDDPRALISVSILTAAAVAAISTREGKNP